MRGGHLPHVEPFAARRSTPIKSGTVPRRHASFVIAYRISRWETGASWSGSSASRKMPEEKKKDDRHAHQTSGSTPSTSSQWRRHAVRPITHAGEKISLREPVHHYYGIKRRPVIRLVECPWPSSCWRP